MKILSVVSFIVLTVLICLTRTTLSERCVIYSDPIYLYKTKVIECPMVKFNQTTLEKRAPDDMFTVDFRCSISNTNLCNKVKNVFISAGKYITATLNLKSTIKVNAQFIDFCKEYGECDTQNVILGAARPSRMVPNQDADGKIRLYPQALFKQLNLQGSHPQLGTSDITALFNSNMNYWFEGDSLPMTARQVDLLYVVIHELTHGLGFTNSWNDYLNMQALTPAIITSPGSPSPFYEFIFDKSLVLLPSGKSLTSITDELNQFQIKSPGSDQEFINSFSQSPQFSIAQGMYKNATTHGTIGFLLNPDVPPNTQLTQDQIQNDVVTLETSLNPYQPSSSFGHVDFQTYINSGDFLMMFTYPPGKTLDEMMSKAGTTKTTGPMGPQLRRLLGVLGYDVKKEYNPPSININSNSSQINFNLVLSLVCILLLTFINYF